MNILSVNNGNSGCDHYRLQVPLGELARHGHEVRLPDPSQGQPLPADLLSTDQDRGMPSDADLEWADVIVGRMLTCPEIVPHWKRWSAFAPTVYDIDDLVTQVDPSNPSLVTFSHPGVQDAVREMLQSATAVTTTTETLAGELRRLGAQVAVCANRIPDGALVQQARKPTGRKVRIGWTASSSHGRDLYDHASMLRQFLIGRPGVELVIMGYDYRRMLGEDLPNVTHLPWVQPPGYYEAIDWDIGIAPLSRSRFNQSKSPIKAIEYGARGIPTVATAGSAYTGYVRTGETGFLARDSADWLRALTWLVDDPQLRQEMGSAALDQAAGMAISGGWSDWEDAYRAARVKWEVDRWDRQGLFGSATIRP